MAESNRLAKRFHHVGLRATEPQPAEHHVPPSKCWVTNPNHHDYRIEYLRYAPDSPISDEFKNSPHVAYKVDDLRPHIAGNGRHHRAIAPYLGARRGRFEQPLARAVRTGIKGPCQHGPFADVHDQVPIGHPHGEAVP